MELILAKSGECVRESRRRRAAPASIGRLAASDWRGSLAAGRKTRTVVIPGRINRYWQDRFHCSGSSDRDAYAASMSTYRYRNRTMTIGSLPPAVASPDCLLPLACKAKQDAAGLANDAFAHYVAPKDIVIHHAAQMTPPPPSDACTAPAKLARYAVNTVRELAFMPPAAYAVKAALEGSESLTREFAELALSPMTYVGQKLGNKIAREIAGQKT